MDLFAIRMIFRALDFYVPDLRSIGCVIEDLGFLLCIFEFGFNT